MNVGRVARRCASTQYGGYWWPRRKKDNTVGGTAKGLLDTGRRYNSQVAERRRYQPADDIAFVGNIKSGPPGIIGLSISADGKLRRLRKDQGVDALKAAIKKGAEQLRQEHCEDFSLPPVTAAQFREQLRSQERHRIRSILSNHSMDTNVKSSAEDHEVAPKTAEDSVIESFHSSDASEILQESSQAPPRSLDNNHEEALAASIDSNPSSIQSSHLPSVNTSDTSSIEENSDEELQYRVNRNYEEAFNDPKQISTWQPIQTQDSLIKHSEIGLKTETTTETKLKDPTIHILGLGPIGKFIAHSLASLPHAPPITLLMHRPLVMQQWHDEGAAITLLRGNKIIPQSNFRIESSADFQRDSVEQRFVGFGQNLEHTSEQPDSVIRTLIVTTDAHTTPSALASIQHRLRPSTTICFVNGGLGLIERVNEELFPDDQNRPSYILGNMTHRIVPTGWHFTIDERKLGEFTCSKIPKDHVRRMENTSISRKDFHWTPESRHVVYEMARTPDFNTRTLGHKSFLCDQLQKLVAESVIGPLSVVYDCSNDKLLYNYHASRTMRYLLEDITSVILALPELSTLPNLDKIFDPKKLNSITVSKLMKTGKNISRMLQDVRAGRRTDIEFYNGYIDRRARQLGIKCRTNEFVLGVVRGKYNMKKQELNGYVPFSKRY